MLFPCFTFSSFVWRVSRLAVVSVLLCPMSILQGLLLALGLLRLTFMDHFRQVSLSLATSWDQPWSAQQDKRQENTAGWGTCCPLSSFLPWVAPSKAAPIQQGFFCHSQVTSSSTYFPWLAVRLRTVQLPTAASPWVLCHPLLGLFATCPSLYKSLFINSLQLKPVNLASCLKPVIQFSCHYLKTSHWYFLSCNFLTRM